MWRRLGCWPRPESENGIVTTCPKSRYQAAGQGASPLPPPPPSNHSKHFSFALIKSLVPSGCFFLYPEPTTRGRNFFSGIACKSRMTNLQVPTTGRKTLQGEILGTHQALWSNGKRSRATGTRRHPKTGLQKAGSQRKTEQPGSSDPQSGQSPPSLSSLQPAHGINILISSIAQD